MGSGTWLDDGRIVFRSRDVLMIVSENGGVVDSLVTSSMVGGSSPVFPVALPGSHGLLLSSCTLSCNKSNAWVVDLKTRKTRRIAENAGSAQYSPNGHILYSDDAGTVHALAFDAKTLTTSGKETSVLEHVAGNVAVARDGTIAYLDGDPSSRSRLVIVAKDGTEQPVDTAWNVNFATLALSPDGKRFAASLLTRAGDEQIWVRPFGTTPHQTRLTFGAAQYTTPTFSADGETIFMTRFAGDSSTFMSRRIDGTSPEVTLARGKNWVIESVASRDGKWLVTRGYRQGERSIYARRIGPTAGADTAERVVVKNASNNFSPALSPDGKWLLYSNEEAGQAEVWVIPFPNAGFARWQVSTDGGSEAAWAPDGKSIYYVDLNRRLVNAEISAGSGITVGTRKVLFDLAPSKRHPTHRAYEVLPDNQHFLMIHQGTRGAGELVMVEDSFGSSRKERRASTGADPQTFPKGGVRNCGFAAMFPSQPVLLICTKCAHSNGSTPPTNGSRATRNRRLWPDAPGRVRRTTRTTSCWRRSTSTCRCSRQASATTQRLPLGDERLALLAMVADGVGGARRRRRGQRDRARDRDAVRRAAAWTATTRSDSSDAAADRAAAGRGMKCHEAVLARAREMPADDMATTLTIGWACGRGTTCSRWATRATTCCEKACSRRCHAIRRSRRSSWTRESSRGAIARARSSTTCCRARSAATAAPVVTRLPSDWHTCTCCAATGSPSTCPTRRSRSGSGR